MLGNEGNYVSPGLSAVAALLLPMQQGQLSDRIQRLKCSILVEFFCQINKISAGLYSVTAEILGVISQ